MGSDFFQQTPPIATFFSQIKNALALANESVFTEVKKEKSFKSDFAARAA